jgi:hypothetical protein
MVYIINTGSMTRYFLSYPTSYLNSYFVQCIFDGSDHHSEVPIVYTAQLAPEYHIQCAVMPTNFIFLCIEFLLAKCMSQAMSDDRADQRPFQVYVNSYLALLNARSKIPARMYPDSPMIPMNYIPLALFRLSWLVIALLLTGGD